MKSMQDCIFTVINNMKIAILSGKGGTGKTLLAVNLAAVAPSAVYLDCDVEEPNGHLFFKPIMIEEEDVKVEIPQVDNEKCDGCRQCIDFCRFNALVYIIDRLLIFKDICHSCGGCMIVCPQKALTSKAKVVGKIRKGISNQVTVYSGILNIGEASGVPIIKKLLTNSKTKETKLTFIDCPPGSACVVMESIKDADYCILVAEPTIFGSHNLNMVYELVKVFDKPFGVVLNKCFDGENPSEKFCLEKDIKILGKIPFDQDLGVLNSNGNIVALANKKYYDLFNTILEQVTMEVSHEATINS